MRPALHTSRRGAAYILALTTLLVGMTLALATLRASGGYFMSEDSRCKKQAAADLAEAGINYAFWQIHYKNFQLPYSADVTLDTGSFHVEAVDNGSNQLSTMKITSTGNYGGVRHKIVRVTLGMLPYRYAWCENREVNDGDSITINGPMGGMRANGRIYLYGAANITTGGWAETSITGSVSPKYTNCPEILFPDVDYSSYSSVATSKYLAYAAITSTQLQLSERRGLIYVLGNVNIRGEYAGIYTIVATGEVVISGDLKRKVSSDTTSFLAIISGSKIQLDSNAKVIQAVLYAHRSDGYGQINAVGYQNVTGSMASDDFITNGPITLALDPAINISVLRQLQMPGL